MKNDKTCNDCKHWREFKNSVDIGQCKKDVCSNWTYSNLKHNDFGVTKKDFYCNKFEE